MPETIVIGAGPAGSIAALSLARAGWRVTLIEQRNFPRDKVCGGCLSTLGVSVLDRLGLLQKIQSLGSTTLSFAEVHPIASRPVRFSLPSAMLGLSRHALDQALLDAARDGGARILQPWRCERVVDTATPVVHARDLVTHEARAITADWIVVADGKPGARSVSPFSSGHRDFGIQAHFENLLGPSDTIELFGCRAAYAGVAAIEESRWNIACAVPSHRIRACRGDIGRLFDAMCAENKALAQRMHGATRLGPWHGAPLPRRHVTFSRGRRVISIGNSAAAIEPVGGEGMGLAMRSAELAADLLVADPLIQQPAATRRLLFDQYRALWRMRDPVALAVGSVASSPGLGKCVAGLLRTGRPLRGSLLWALGKAHANRVVP